MVDTVTLLAGAIDLSDHYTRDHSQRVLRVAAQISRQVPLPDEEAAGIRLAALPHEIGKIGIPSSGVARPGASQIRALKSVFRSQSAIAVDLAFDLIAGESNKALIFDNLRDREGC